jgi:hypothetical protein
LNAQIVDDINLLMRIATENVSLCVPMKSWLRLWNSNRQLGVAANRLDKLARFFQTRRRLNGSESGGVFILAEVLRLLRVYESQNDHGAEKKGNIIP